MVYLWEIFHSHLGPFSHIFQLFEHIVDITNKSWRTTISVERDIFNPCEVTQITFSPGKWSEIKLFSNRGKHQLWYLFSDERRKRFFFSKDKCGRMLAELRLGKQWGAGTIIPATPERPAECASHMTWRHESLAPPKFSQQSCAVLR